MEEKDFDEEGILDNFEDDIFFDDFILSDFADVESFLINSEDANPSLRGSDFDQSSIRRQNAKKSKIKKRKFDEIAADDPRKQLTDLTVAAIGLGDEKKIKEVFETYYTSDCVFIIRFTKDTPELPNHREVYGRQKMIDFIMNVIESCPDCVLKVVGRQLNIYKDGSSYLVAKLNFAASWLMAAPLELFEPLDQISTPTVDSNPSLPTSATESSTAISIPTESFSAESAAQVAASIAPSSTTSKPTRKRIHIAVSNVSHINLQGQIFKVDTYMKADIQEDADSSDDDDF